MYEDRIDEQKLINTLKGILKRFLPSESLPMEKTVNRYLDIKFKNLSEVSNSEDNVIFYFASVCINNRKIDKNGINILKYFRFRHLRSCRRRFCDSAAAASNRFSCSTRRNLVPPADPSLSVPDDERGNF